jgi:hypothetical protein
MKGLITVKNDILLNWLLSSDFDVSKFVEFGFNLTLPTINPSQILSAIF